MKKLLTLVGLCVLLNTTACVNTGQWVSMSEEESIDFLNTYFHSYPEMTIIEGKKWKDTSIFSDLDFSIHKRVDFTLPESLSTQDWLALIARDAKEAINKEFIVSTEIRIDAKKERHTPSYYMAFNESNAVYRAEYEFVD